ncbi:MAG TPA: peroxidase-related enzyme [Burkholderiales bacterium]|nr:peroxidase-related enzyme [Burkholderiales bacterium]
MSRIQPVDPQTATGEARELLQAVQSQLGAVPAFLRVLAHSPKALGAFLGMHASLGAGALDHATQERIALAVAESNACEYCVSAHTAIGRKAGLSNEEMLLNRQGGSADRKAAAAVVLARALNEHRGEVTGAEFDAARAAGLSDAEIVEVIGAVALNFFTNVIGKATRVEIDFPKVKLLPDTHRAAA